VCCRGCQSLQTLQHTAYLAQTFPRAPSSEQTGGTAARVPRTSAGKPCLCTFFVFRAKFQTIQGSRGGPSKEACWCRRRRRGRKNARRDTREADRHRSTHTNSVPDGPTMATQELGCTVKLSPRRTCITCIPHPRPAFKTRSRNLLTLAATTAHSSCNTLP
jgi:hypothetical protein